jgi:diguanylate cyclase (GGDEF)-like protein/putative nucleotidyltransferase with HDIG domain
MHPTPSASTGACLPAWPASHRPAVKHTADRAWVDRVLWSAPVGLVIVGTAALAGRAIERDLWWLLLVLGVPLALTGRAYRMLTVRLADERKAVREATDTHFSTILTLARAIDATDQLVDGHLERLQAYAGGLARRLGLSPIEVDAVCTAALLHDIGKMAIPGHILAKSGPLTEAEFQKVRQHPRIGAEILATVRFPSPVAPIVLNHHERWDGNGYPSGRKGEAIPLGARILAVADMFDTLTSDRPYHPAMTPEAALDLMAREAGRALDPDLVARFINSYQELTNEVRRVDERLAPGAGDTAAPATAPRPRDVFDDIGRAHREIHALYEMAQVIGRTIGVAETMTLITSRLERLVPHSSAALYLYDEQTDTLRCAFATGVDAALLEQIVVRNGDGATGWVARHRRSLMNARPFADFEAAGFPSVPTTLQSAVISPLVLGDRLVGALAAYHAEPGRYRDDDRRLLDRVAEQAASAIQNSLVFEQTKEASLTDALTGLPNTRFLSMHLGRELARAERLRSPIALLVVDMDNFKDVNDTYGHQVGDEVLVEVARVIRSCVRPYDICARYAGDEFIVVLSGCGTEEAEHKRLELKQAIEQLFAEPRPGARLALSASVGAAVFPEDGAVYEALLTAADHRMYQDKGRRLAGRAASAGSKPVRDDAPTRALEPASGQVGFRLAARPGDNQPGSFSLS